MTPVTTTARDGAWFEALFREHARSVFRYVARRAARDDADDLTADVLAVAWRRRDEVPEGHELAWLYRTAAFTVANHHRKSRPVLVEVLPEGPDRDSPELLVVADLEVRAALATLSERDREVLLLTAWEGVDGEGLARALGISRGGADAALSRARSRLRDAFAAQDRPEAGVAPRTAPTSAAPRKDGAAHDTDRVTGRQGGPAPRRT